jgi:hypothetical protein
MTIHLSPFLQILLFLVNLRQTIDWWNGRVLEQSIVCWMSTDSMFGFPKNLGSISKMRFCSIEVRNDCQHNDYHNKDTQHNNKELKQRINDAKHGNTQHLD